jgi:hypothetical protein
LAATVDERPQPRLSAALLIGAMMLDEGMQSSAHAETFPLHDRRVDEASGGERGGGVGT